MKLRPACIAGFFVYFESRPDQLGLFFTQIVRKRNRVKPFTLI